MIAVTTLVWFFVTILMMGFFAGIEMAFYSANRFGIELKKKQGRHSAILLSRFIENPQLFLSTTLIGFTLFLVSFVLLFSEVTRPLWDLIGLAKRYCPFVLDILLATFIVLIFAEFIPRAIFRANSNVHSYQAGVADQFLLPDASTHWAAIYWSFRLGVEIYF